MHVALMGGANSRLVMRQMGHTSVELTLSVDAQVVEGEEPTAEELAASEWLLAAARRPTLRHWCPKPRKTQ